MRGSAYHIASSMRPELSVVIPLLDEAPNVEALCREITATLINAGLIDIGEVS